VFFDLIGMTHLGPWDDLAPTPRRWLTRTALGLAVCFLSLSLFLAFWRASVVVPDFIPADLATKFEGIALTFPIPLMLVATALIAWGAIAMPWLAWILIVGALAIVMLLAALVLRAVSRALPPLAVLLGGLLRVLGIAGIVLLIGVIALAMGIYFVLSVVSGRRLGSSRRRSSTPSACSRKSRMRSRSCCSASSMRSCTPAACSGTGSRASIARVRSTCSRSARSRHARFGSPRGSNRRPSRKPLANPAEGPTEAALSRVRQGG